MFSKALFKQSCKANGTMWAIITFAVCFMLACVMLISGSGSIGKVKNSIQDTIIIKEIDSQLQKRAINYYTNAEDGLNKFDSLFAANATDTLSYIMWISQKPDQANFSSQEEYAYAIEMWQSHMPTLVTEVGKAYAESISEWQNSIPAAENFDSTEAYMAAVNEWMANTPVSQEKAVAVAYAGACEDLKAYIYAKALAIDSSYTEESTEAQEMLGSVMYVLNPDGTFNDFYTSNGENIPDDYDIMSIIEHIASSDVEEYVASTERAEYRNSRAESGSSIFIAGNMSQQENVDKIVNQLSSFGVTKEKYDSFGYTYDSLKHISATAVITYRNRLEYELGILEDKYINGAFATEDDYLNAVAEKTNSLVNEISGSLLSSLPQEVSDALEEVGKADLYTLIVGSIFYKLAGLLLPIIYMIMASNNLIAGQVDSGSMAYVLSTSTKRNTVVFTQAVYLIGSLLAMFALTTATGCVCLSIVTEDVTLTYGNLVLLNIGAFLVLFALSGLCFFTSCWFDRSKRSMAIGGGLSIFALVAAMLGLFGSPVIPSVVRLDALNNFNYTTIITFFDVISIIDGTKTFIWKFAILAVCGIIGYIVGSIRFTKKDLPL